MCENPKFVAFASHCFGRNIGWMNVSPTKSKTLSHPGTQGPDLTLNLVQVFINFVHQNGQICAGMGTLLPDNGTNLYPNIFLNLKLT